MRKIGQIFRFLIPVIALVALVVFLTGAGRRERATVEKNKAIVMRDFEVWNKGDMAALDEIYASNCIYYTTPGSEGNPEGILRGREALKQHLVNCRTAFPDLHITLMDDLIAEGDKVACHWAWRSTFTGVVKEWGIPPTGKEVTFDGITIYQIAGGKIVKLWEYYRELTLWYQMGMKLVPAEQPGK